MLGLKLNQVSKRGHRPSGRAVSIACPRHRCTTSDHVDGLVLTRWSYCSLALSHWYVAAVERGKCIPRIVSNVLVQLSLFSFGVQCYYGGTLALIQVTFKMTWIYPGVWYSHHKKNHKKSVCTHHDIWYTHTFRCWMSQFTLKFIPNNLGYVVVYFYGWSHHSPVSVLGSSLKMRGWTFRHGSPFVPDIYSHLGQPPWVFHSLWLVVLAVLVPLINHLHHHMLVHHFEKKKCFKRHHLSSQLKWERSMDLQIFVLHLIWNTIDILPPTYFSLFL